MQNIFQKKNNIDFQNEKFQSDSNSNQENNSDKNLIDVDNYKADIKLYNDPEGLTVRKMGIGLWFVANRKNFRIIFMGFLLIIIVYTWSIFLYTFGSHVFFGMKADQSMLKGLLSNNLTLYNFLQSNPLKGLIIGAPESIKIAENRYDFYVKISNPNEKYWAHFDYVFMVGSNKTKQESGFILPGETKYILLLGSDMPNYSGNIIFKIEKIYWQQVDSRKYKNWKSFAVDHLKINMDNINFTSAQSSNLSEKISINSLDFSASNNTAYNYWNIAFVALLFNGNKIVGVNHYVANQFLSGQTQNISITWPENISRVSNVLVIPEIDITRDDIYMKFEGGIGDEK